MTDVAYGNQFLLPYVTSLNTNYHVDVRNDTKRINGFHFGCLIRFVSLLSSSAVALRDLSGRHTEKQVKTFQRPMSVKAY